NIVGRSSVYRVSRPADSWRQILLGRRFNPGVTEPARSDPQGQGPAWLCGSIDSLPHVQNLLIALPSPARDDDLKPVSRPTVGNRFAGLPLVDHRDSMDFGWCPIERHVEPGVADRSQHELEQADEDQPPDPLEQSLPEPPNKQRRCHEKRQRSEEPIAK